MKFSRTSSRGSSALAMWILFALVAVACVALNAAASATNQTASVAGNSKTNSVATNSAPVELPITLSMFDLTIKPTKDPFFPHSLRQAIPVITTNIPAYDPASFALKALSGTKTEPLAIINNRTFAVGETNEVSTPNGKIKIKCLEIKPTSVVIVADGHFESIEIFLRKIVQ